MKKLAVIAGIVVLAALVFAAGTWVGLTINLAHHLPATTSLVDEHALAASTAASLVRQLNAGEVDEAKSSLNLTLDSHILTIGMLLPECRDQKSKRLATSILARIAKDRKTASASFDDAGVDAEIERILSSALEESEQ